MGGHRCVSYRFVINMVLDEEFRELTVRVHVGT